MRLASHLMYWSARPAAMHLNRNHAFDAVLGYGFPTNAYTAARIAEELNRPSVVWAIGSDVNTSASISSGNTAITREIVKRSTVVLTESDALRVKLKQLCPHARNIQRYYKGIDINFLHQVGESREGLRARFGILAESKCMVTVGAVHRAKGVWEFFETFRTLASEDETVVAVVAGDGPDREALRTAAREAGLEHRFLLTGEISREDVGRLLKAADVMLFPSHSEGLPNAVMEALAARLPVVATDVGGIREVIRPERTGLLVPKEDVPAMVNAVRQMLDEPSFARSTASAGQERILRDFDVDKNVYILRDMLAQLVGGLRTRAPGKSPGRPRNRSMSNPVPVILGSAYNGYSLVRALGEQGIRSILAYHQPGSAFFSRYVSGRWHLPSEYPTAETVASLIAHARRLRRSALLMPTSEAWVHAILTKGAALAEVFVLPTCNRRAAELAVDKIAMHSWCLRTGVRVPPVMCFETGDDWSAFVRSAIERLPLILKPKTKGVNDNSLGFAYRTFHDREALEAWAGELTPKGPACGVICQQIIPGPVENLVSLQGYVSKQGDLYMCGYTKVRQMPPTYGCSSAAYVRATGEAAKAAADILRKLEYRGMFDLEFKRHAEDGNLYFIELNPRAGMLNYSATACGMNLAHLEYLDACRKPLPPPKTLLATEWTWIRLLYDFAAHVIFYRRRRPQEHTPLRTYVKSLRGKLLDPCINLADPGVAIATVIKWVWDCLVHLRSGRPRWCRGIQGIG
jgi:glycosyltransferase involved in cell wall biosynthesis/predicted ATP-grasp superfamily ATP-dependent carboligase